MVSEIYINLWKLITCPVSHWSLLLCELSTVDHANDLAVAELLLSRISYQFIDAYWEHEILRYTI